MVSVHKLLVGHFIITIFHKLSRKKEAEFEMFMYCSIRMKQLGKSQVAYQQLKQDGQQVNVLQALLK